MTLRLTQALVNRAGDDHPPGTQLYDAEVSGLRLVVGRRSSSFKLVGRINDATGRYVSIVIGRTDEVSLRTARIRAAELRLALRRGEDPRMPRRSVPTLRQAWERYRDARAEELRPRTVEWYEGKFSGPLRPLLDLPMDRLDRERIRTLHERLTRRRGPYCANGAMRALKVVHTDAVPTELRRRCKNLRARALKFLQDEIGAVRHTRYTKADGRHPSHRLWSIRDHQKWADAGASARADAYTQHVVELETEKERLLNAWLKCPS